MASAVAAAQHRRCIGCAPSPCVMPGQRNQACAHCVNLSAVPRAPRLRGRRYSRDGPSQLAPARIGRSGAAELDARRCLSCLRAPRRRGSCAWVRRFYRCLTGVYICVCELEGVLRFDKVLGFCDVVRIAFSGFLRRPSFFDVSFGRLLVTESLMVLGDQNISTFRRRCFRGHVVPSLCSPDPRTRDARSARLTHPGYGCRALKYTQSLGMTGQDHREGVNPVRESGLP
jgi:hypothetical protein